MATIKENLSLMLEIKGKRKVARGQCFSAHMRETLERESGPTDSILFNPLSPNTDLSQMSPCIYQLGRS